MDPAEISTVCLRRERNQPREVPRRLTLQVTNLCNSRCTMCHIWKLYRDDRALLATELSGAELMLVTRSAIARGVRMIDVTGGEPFLKTGMLDVLALVLRELRCVGVTTNAMQYRSTGAQIERVAADAPPDSKFIVSVSIDGFAETHARIRGVHDGYDRGVALLRQLNHLKRTYPQLLTNISFTIMDQNHGEMEELMDYMLGEGVIQESDQFTFRPVQSSHYYRRDNGSDRNGELVAMIERIQARHRFARNDTFVRGIRRSLLHPGRMLLPCQAMFASCWIDPYGGVAPCVTMTDRIVGNLRDSDFDLLPIWNSDEASRVRAEIRRDACPVCWTDCQAHENIEYSPAAAAEL